MGDHMKKVQSGEPLKIPAEGAHGLHDPGGPRTCTVVLGLC